MFPEFNSINPVNAYINSLCPFPSIPAMQTISPALTSKETFSIIFLELLLDFIFKSLTDKIISLGLASLFSTTKDIFLPTIISDISSFVASFTSIVPIYFPFRKTEHLSATSFISFNLCVINKIDFPSLVNDFIIFINSSISFGVKTAVGSSNISISLSL